MFLFGSLEYIQFNDCEIVIDYMRDVGNKWLSGHVD